MRTKHANRIIRTLNKFQIDPKLGAEIGVEFGNTANILLNTFSELHLFLVDNYKTSPRRVTPEIVKNEAFRKLDIHGERITWLLYSSVKASESMDSHSLDYAFIDASHDYKSVKKDIQHWFYKVKVGGLLLGHDFTDKFPGVQKAVKEIFGDDFSVVGDVWYVQVTKDLVRAMNRNIEFFNHCRKYQEKSSGLYYCEFSIGKTGKLKNEKGFSYLGEELTSLLFDFYKNAPRECLYQLTTQTECPEERRNYWDLWVQMFANSQGEALEFANDIRMRILSEEFPREGHLTNDGKLKQAANFGGNIQLTKNRTYKLLCIFMKYGLNVKSGAEIGVQVGQNAAPLLRKITNLHLLLVDNYDDSLEIHRCKCSVLKEIAVKRLLEFDDRTTWMFKPSVVAAKEVKNKSLDYVYIDALHDYTNVRNDIEAWLPKVKVGGLLLGHDYTVRYRGLRKAVAESFGDSFKRDGDIWWVQIT